MTLIETPADIHLGSPNFFLISVEPQLESQPVTDGDTDIHQSGSNAAVQRLHGR